jgi:CBS domain-containing protein
MRAQSAEPPDGTTVVDAESKQRATAYRLAMTVHAAEIAATFETVSIRDAMHAGVLTSRPEDDLTALARVFVTHGVHAVVLEQTSDAAPLMLTDLELIRAALWEPQDTRARDLARDPIATLPADSPLADAAARMSELDDAHLLATDPASGAPCGVISSFDVAAVIGGDRPSRARMIRPSSVRRRPSPGTLGDARAGDVMHPAVVTCAPDVPIWIVAQCMAEHRVQCVAVAGVSTGGPHSHHYSWGLVNDMELVRAFHRDALTAPAVSIASTAPAAVTQDDSLAAAAALMVEDDTSHVVVVGPSGLPCGMISTLDVAAILAAA